MVSDIQIDTFLLGTVRVDGERDHAIVTGDIKHIQKSQQISNVNITGVIFLEENTGDIALISKGVFDNIKAIFQFGNRLILYLNGSITCSRKTLENSFNARQNLNFYILLTTIKLVTVLEDRSVSMATVDVSVNFAIFKTDGHLVGVIAVGYIFCRKQNATVQQIEVQFAGVEKRFFNSFCHISGHFLLAGICFHREIVRDILNVADSNVHLRTFLSFL